MMILLKASLVGGGVLAAAAITVADVGITIPSIAMAFTGLALVWFGSTILRMRDDVIKINETLNNPSAGLSHRMTKAEECLAEHQDDIDKIKYGRRRGDTGSERSD